MVQPGSVLWITQYGGCGPLRWLVGLVRDGELVFSILSRLMRICPNLTTNSLVELPFYSVILVRDIIVALLFVACLVEPW